MWRDKVNASAVEFTLNTAHTASYSWIQAVYDGIKHIDLHEQLKV